MFGPYTIRSVSLYEHDATHEMEKIDTIGRLI